MAHDPPKDIHSFEEFWPHYVRAHANPKNRAVHVFGTSAGIVFVLLSPVLHYMSYLFLLPVVVYGPLWLGHYIFEGNKPASFRYPLWSLRGDLRLCFRIVTGRKLAP